MLFSAQYRISLRISSVLDNSNQNIEPFQLQFAQCFPTNIAAIARETMSIITTDTYRPVAVLDGGQVGWMYAPHEKLEAKDKFRRALKVFLFLSIHSNRTIPSLKQHSQRPPNTPSAHILATVTKNGSISVAYEDLVASILAEATIKKNVLSQNFTKMSNIILRSDVSTSEDDVNLSNNIIRMRHNRIEAEDNVLRVLLGYRSGSVPGPK